MEKSKLEKLSDSAIIRYYNFIYPMVIQSYIDSNEISEFSSEISDNNNLFKKIFTPIAGGSRMDIEYIWCLIKNNEEKIAAINVREILSELILHKYVHLENIQTEKYGRILADVYIENLHINKYLLDNKYAVPYDGGKKIIPENWLDYMKNVPSAHNTNIQL